MPSIQIGLYSFTLSEPYSEGQVMNEAEARVLNSQRTERLRNVIYKRLSALEAEAGQGLLPTDMLIELTAEIKELDRQFEFVSHPTTQRQKGTLQSTIFEVAREMAATRLRANGSEPTDEATREAAELLVNDSLIVDEGRRRFLAHQEVVKGALAELMK